MRHAVDVYTRPRLMRKRVRTIVFTDHAIDRIQERCSIKMSKLQHVFEKDICVNVGKDNEGCSHLLFYEPYKMRHFVAICIPSNEDPEHTWVIKTVLELIIHEALSWPVTEKQLHQSATLNKKYFIR